MLKLDLHGKTHEEARRETIRFVEANWKCGEIADIITGNSEAMKEVVGKVLDEYQLDWLPSAVLGYISVDLE